MTSTDPNRQKLTQLRKLLIQHFSLDELRVLCFDLGLEYEELAGDTRTTKIHSLIEFLQRRGELPRLLAEANDHRPNVAWPAFENGNPEAQINELASQNNPKSVIHEKSGLEMLLIPAGEFLYGEKKELKFLLEFWISKTPVTNAHYAEFVKDARHAPPDHWGDGKCPANLASHPVVNVTWHDTVAYMQWSGLQLPTEQQWEKAARGQDGREYPWGNEWKPYCNTKEAGIGTTTPVGYYIPFGDSPYGCVDMSGNVWEWTSSWYDEKEKYRCLRGGAFDYTLWNCRVAYRDLSYPALKYDCIGFRPAKNLRIPGS